MAIFAKMIRATVVWLAISAALLFVPAGTLDWPQAWIFLAELCLLVLLSGSRIARHDL